jgi:acetyl esterase/lipase
VAGLAGLAAQAASVAGLLALQRSAAASGGVLEAALSDGLGPGYREVVRRAGLEPLGPDPSAWRPLPPWLSRRAHLRAEGLVYGPDRTRNRLDIWCGPRPEGAAPAPVLVQVPGGGWTTGDTRHQAYPLMHRLTGAGWLCVPISYRLSPAATFPDHLVDVKRALAWVKANIARYGGDPRFVVVTGGSAGGHLAALAALTAGCPEYQPGFEHADTSVAAAVCMYGVYDLLDWDGRGGQAASVRHVQDLVMKTAPDEDRGGWLEASPTHRAGPQAPPMMILHGRNDSLVPVYGARRFASVLATSSANPVVYAELPHAQHAFDIYGSVRTLHTARAVDWFLAWVRAGGSGPVPASAPPTA